MAKDAASNSASSQFTVIISTISSAPQNLQATAGTGSVTLQWQVPSSNGGSPITNYKIYRSSSSGTEGYLSTLGNVTSYNDTGLASGHTYFYKITAVNSIGTSRTANEASATTFTISSAPQNLQATAHIGSVTLQWQVPSSNGGSPITNYKIYRSSSSGTEGYLKTVRNVNSYTNTGLASGHTYFYKVTAVNSVGSSTQSNQASATTLTQTLPSDDAFSLVPVSKAVNSQTCQLTGSKGWICRITTTYVQPPSLGSATVYLEQGGSETSLGSITDTGIINNIPRDTDIKIIVSGGFQPITKLIHTPVSQTNYAYTCTVDGCNFTP